MKNNKNVVVKKVCHSRQFLSGIFHILICYIHKEKTLYINNQYVEDPRLQASGMTPLFNNGAFTLIELLVVVLIIGILAAVAVPQYKKAVVKSRAAQLQTLFADTVKAAELYYLHNGTYPSSFDQLDIDIDLPTTSQRFATTCAGTLVPSSAKTGKDFEIAIYTGGAGQKYRIGAWFTSGKYKCTGFIHWLTQDVPGTQEKTFCAECYYERDCGTNCDNGAFCHDVLGLTEFHYMNNIHMYK